MLLSNDGAFTTHIDSTCAKASRTLGFLSRTLKAYPEKLKTLAFNSMCRSTLEYAAPIWDPYQTTDMKKFDKIQRRGARFVTRNYSRSTRGEQIVKDLTWEDLSTRRYHSRLILFYPIIPFIENQFIDPDSRGRFHALTHKHIGYKHSYYPQTIRDWNCLPQQDQEQPQLGNLQIQTGGAEPLATSPFTPPSTQYLKGVPVQYCTETEKCRKCSITGFFPRMRNLHDPPQIQYGICMPPPPVFRPPPTLFK